MSHSDRGIERRFTTDSGFHVTVKAVPPVLLAFAARLELAAVELDMIRADEGGPSEGDVRIAARDWCLRNNRADYKALKAALIRRDFEVTL